ncbi:MAG: hypothetical protein IPM92_15550 [Saprospiraceae bacterium]|nr:hypothetical protein [Saprospiraceae bacterium]
MVYPIYDLQQNHIICEGETVIIGSSQYTKSGLYLDSLLTDKGCDSIIHTQVTVNPKHLFQQQLQICKGQFTRVGNNIYNATGFYQDRLNNIFGCDSIVETNLFVDTVEAQLQIGYDSVLW